MPTEKIVRGAAGHVVEHFRKKPFKGEFVIVVAGKESR
jgi:16S rRNA C1402 (ribose-2'-O) methylase RsmI